MSDLPRPLVKGCLVLGVGLVVVLLAPALVGRPAPLQFVFHVLTGWFRHAVVNVPHLGWEPVTVGLGVLCGLAATLLTHHFIKTIRRGPWAPRQTMLVVALFLAATAAAVGMTGIVHELAWLARTPLTQSNRAVDRTLATSNGKQLHLALLEADMEGRHPETLEELVEFGVLDRETLADLASYSVPGSEAKERFVLLQPGRDVWSMPPGVPVLAAFGFPERHCVVVFNDAAARYIANDELNRLLDEKPWERPNPEEE